MLEILGIVLLSNINKKNALARGRKPGVFVALTFILWLVPEFCVGFVAGMLELGPIAYLYALMAAASGGLVSYLIAKFGRQGDYVPPARTTVQNVIENADPLESPAELTLNRVSSMVSSLVAWTFTLNGKEVGRLKNGESLKFSTRQRQNVLVAKDAYGTELPPFVFEVEAGAEAELFFKVNRFLPEQSTGLRQSSPTAISAAAPAVSAALVPEVAAKSDAGLSRQAAFCHKCGTALHEDMRFCENCGQPRFALPPSGMPEPVSVQVPQIFEASADHLPGIDKPQEMFAVWLSIWLTGAWILNFILHIGTRMQLSYDSNYATLASTAILACSAWLILQKGSRFKAFGAGVGVLAVLLDYFTVPMHLINRQTGGLVNLVPDASRGARFLSLENIFEILRSYTDHVAIWRQALLAVGSVVLFYQLLRKCAPARRLQLTALFSSLTIFLVEGLLGIILTPVFFHMYGFFVSFLIRQLIGAITFGLVLLALESRASMRNRRIILSGWGLAWCLLTVFGSLSSLVLLPRAAVSSARPLIFSGQQIMFMAWLVGYIVMLAGRRLGWYFVLIATVIGCGAQFALAAEVMATSSLRFATLSGYTALFTASLIGPLNPLITWFSIRRAWRAADDQSGAQASRSQSHRPYRTFDRFAAIFNLVAGLLLLVSLIISTISIARFEPGMLPALIISLFTIGQASWSLSVMKRKYPSGLRVLTTVVFVVMAVMMSSAVVIVLSRLFE